MHRVTHQAKMVWSLLVFRKKAKVAERRGKDQEEDERSMDKEESKKTGCERVG